MKPPEKLPNQQTCSMLCIYKYKYQYIIFHCHPPIGLVATPVCLNPSQANSTDAPSGDGWQYIYIYVFIVCWSSLSVAVELMCLLYHQNPLQPPKSLLELPEVIDEDLSDGQWKFQPTKMRCSIGFPFVIYHLVAMHDT